MLLSVPSGTAVPSGTSLAPEAALPAPALTLTPPTLPLRWSLPHCSLHSVVGGHTNVDHGVVPHKFARQSSSAYSSAHSDLPPRPSDVCFLFGPGIESFYLRGIKEGL